MKMYSKMNKMLSLNCSCSMDDESIVVVVVAVAAAYLPLQYLPWPRHETSQSSLMK